MKNTDVIDIEPLDHEIYIDSFDCGVPSLHWKLRDAYYHQIYRLSSASKILFNDQVIGYYIIKYVRNRV